MSANDADDLDCDFAEIYGITDRLSLPPLKAAVLAGGLFSSERKGRLRRKYGGKEIPAEQLLLAGVADRLSVLIWQQTKDGRRNRNQPASILAKLIDEEPENKTLSFSSAEEFEAERTRRIKKIRS